MKPPCVSVVMPYRDAADTVGAALESVLGEPDVLEVIAVDDGSRDGGLRVAHERVVHVRTEGIGVARALRVGMERARGELVARMDADDLSLPGRIAAEVALLDSDPSIAVASCAVECFGEVTEGMRAYVAWQNAIVSPVAHARAMFIEAPVCHPSVTMRRAVLEAVGGYRDVPWAEDYDLWLRLDAAGHRFAKVPEILFSWGQRASSTTRRDVRCSPERMRMARAVFLAPRLTHRPFLIWGAGPTGKRLARELEHHGLRPTRFIDIDPRKIGRTRRGVPVVGHRELPRDHTVVIAVGARGARDLVCCELASLGLVDGRDFIAAA